MAYEEAKEEDDVASSFDILPLTNEESWRMNPVETDIRSSNAIRVKDVAAAMGSASQCGIDPPAEMEPMCGRGMGIEYVVLQKGKSTIKRAQEGKNAVKLSDCTLRSNQCICLSETNKPGRDVILFLLIFL